MLLESFTPLCATSFCQCHLPFQSVQYVFPLAFSASSLFASPSSSDNFKNLTLFSVHHHYSSLKHAHVIALYLPWPVHPKYLSNPANPEVLGNYILNQFNFSHYSYHCLSVLLRIAIPFSLRHHVYCCYPTSSEECGHGGRTSSPKSRVTL